MRDAPQSALAESLPTVLYSTTSERSVVEHSADSPVPLDTSTTLRVHGATRAYYMTLNGTVNRTYAETSMAESLPSDIVSRRRIHNVVVFVAES